MSLSCVIWVCLMLDCWLTQCCVDYRTRICQRRYLALLAEIRRQRQAQREREEHEEEERRRQQLEDERKRRLEQENLRKTCPLCSHRSVLMAVACVKVVCVCVCVCLQDLRLHRCPCRGRRSRSPGRALSWTSSPKRRIWHLCRGRAASCLRCDISDLSKYYTWVYEITSST